MIKTDLFIVSAEIGGKGNRILTVKLNGHIDLSDEEGANWISGWVVRRNEGIIESIVSVEKYAPNELRIEIDRDGAYDDFFSVQFVWETGYIPNLETTKSPLYVTNNITPVPA